MVNFFLPKTEHAKSSVMRLRNNPILPSRQSGLSSGGQDFQPCCSLAGRCAGHSLVE
jgi:hypothetical protein